MAHTPRVLASERLARLLESYGAASERWPRDEREAVRRLIARSATAKRRWEDASYLDHLLDALEPDAPSAALVGGVLAASPARRPGRIFRRAVVVAASLAAAAALMLWARSEPAPLRRAAEAMRLPVGVYTTATDVLLDSFGIDVHDPMPSVGCADSVLGCPDVKGTGGPASQRRARERARA